MCGHFDREKLLYRGKDAETATCSNDEYNVINCMLSNRLMRQNLAQHMSFEEKRLPVMFDKAYCCSSGRNDTV
ncbi:hypothetical protein E2P81_ATG09447 [Venturia nashicola]|uniref:Uncharacterized protein n=1 Tax=Venturia nashicola TaxID=86259 RepID=A0A4Z1P8B7_9PEZI|nr:hypothetical protein E6O75_ATG09656 [Venturia nashicola]TLD25790.1 hypothetical protein E2P81_ATG09447 [Venturia nashicola]